MRVTDVLTWGIVSVRPEDPLERAVDLMLGERISGLPVTTSEGQLVGILTEGDLLRRAELGSTRKRARWLEMLIDPGRMADEYSRARGRRVEAVMTRDVVTVSAEAPLEQAIELLTAHGIKRLPVLQAGRIIGILSRSDVMRALSRAMKYRDGPSDRTDAEIQSDLDAEFAQLPFSTEAVLARVHDGVVTLSGSIVDERDRRALRVAAENVAGVRGIKDEIVWVDPITTAVAF